MTETPEPREGESRPEPARHVRRGLMLGVLATGQVTVVLDATIVNVALPAIQADLEMTATTLQYVVTVYGALLGGFLLFCGRSADLFGRRRMLLVGLAGFTVSSFAAAVASTTTVLLVARGAQGLAGAFVITAALSMLTSIYEQGPARNRALAIWGALTGSAATAAVILGGLLTEGPGWRWIFGINVPVGIVAFVMALVVLPRADTPDRPRLDLPGAVLLTGGLLALIVGITRAEAEGWGSRSTFATLGAAVGLLVVFVVVERRTEDPLIDFAILRIPTLRGANVVALVLYGAMFAMYYVLSLLMQQVLGWSPLQTGLAYVPLAIALIVGSEVASRLLARLRARPLLVATLLVAALTFVLLARVPVDASFVVDLLGPFVLIGLAFGLLSVLVQVLAFTGVDERESGVAAGLINTTQEIGGVLGTALLATVAAAVTGARSGPAATLDGFRVALLVGAGLLLVGAVAARFLFARESAQPVKTLETMPATPGE